MRASTKSKRSKGTVPFSLRENRDSPPGSNRIAGCLGLCVIMAAGCLTVGGCGKKGLQTKVVHGTVTYGDQKVEAGYVRFVPIDGTPGPASTARITDGQYRIEARGGIPLGTHRIEVEARGNMPSRVPIPKGVERWAVDRMVRLGPKKYAGNQSPLKIELTADLDGRADIKIPRHEGTQP